MSNLSDSWIILIGIAVLAAMWFCTVIVYIVVHMAANRHLRQLMDNFGERYPDRCFLCSYYSNVLNTLPPEHKCANWIKEP